MFAMLSVPLVALAPLHPPEAVQAVAFVDDQVNVVEPPEATDVGFAEIVAIGGGSPGRKFTLAVTGAELPPAPLQMSVNVDGVMMLLTTSLPLVARGPVQAPDAVHDVAFVDDQVIVAAPPAAIVAGFAAIVAVGREESELTITVVETGVELPPAPLQLSVNVDAARRLLTTSLPLVARDPAQAPVAVQAVALVDDQVNVVEPPAVTTAGFAEIVAVGEGTAGLTVTFAETGVELPPAPVQVSVNVEAARRLLTTSLPLVVRDPAQAPVAVQAVASVDDQVTVVDPPAVTGFGLAVTVTVGAGGVPPLLPPPPPPPPHAVRAAASTAAITERAQ
jgi:hypothetical protein